MDRTLGKFLIKFFDDLKDFKSLEKAHSNRNSLVKRLARSIALIFSSVVFIAAVLVSSIFSATGSLWVPSFDLGLEALSVVVPCLISFIFAAGIKSIMQPLVTRFLNRVLDRRFSI
jgi:hypothetical protein